MKKSAMLFGAMMLAQGALAQAAPAYKPAFDPRAHRDFAGPATELIVLGSPHLSGMPDNFKTDSLGLLLDRLAAWKPEIITIEDVAGPECEMLQRYKTLYGEAFDTYCWDLAPIEKATGLSVVAATVEAETLIAKMPANPTPAMRRHLAMVFIASGNRASAMVQWLRLPAAERHEGDGLNAELVAILRKGETSRNESYAVAAALAARLGLERVYPADDHTADATVSNMGAEAEKAYEAAITKVWAASAGRLAAMKVEQAKLGTPAATLDYYRWHNRPERAMEAYNGDFGAALKEPSAERFGRRYVGWWETRNLHMIGNIRAAFTAKPGARVLSIVGSSHKGYFEAYLEMMSDVRLVDVEGVLR